MLTQSGLDASSTTPVSSAPDPALPGADPSLRQRIATHGSNLPAVMRPVLMGTLVRLRWPGWIAAADPGRSVDCRRVALGLLLRPRGRRLRNRPRPLFLSPLRAPCSSQRRDDVPRARRWIAMALSPPRPEPLRIWLTFRPRGALCPAPGAPCRRSGQPTVDRSRFRTALKRIDLRWSSRAFVRRASTLDLRHLGRDGGFCSRRSWDAIFAVSASGHPKRCHAGRVARREIVWPSFLSMGSSYSISVNFNVTGH